VIAMKKAYTVPSSDLGQSLADIIANGKKDSCPTKAPTNAPV